MPAVTIPFGRHGVQLEAIADDPELTARFVADTPLNTLDPPDLAVGRVSARAAASPLTLGAGRRAVTFEGAAGAAAALATCDSAADVLREVGLSEALDALQLTWPEGGRFIAVAAEYDIEGTASGHVALGALPGRISAGAGASRFGRYAVVQRVADPATGLRSAVVSLLGAAALPADIETAADLAPDTWIITEADGALSAQLGAQLGYAFSWVREAAHRTVGDIGLAVRLAADLACSVQARSRFLVVMTRGRRSGSPAPIAPDSVRMQILRTTRTSQAGALSIAANTQLSTPLPDSPVEFLEAAFGLRVEQLLADVRRMAAVVANPASAAEAVLSIAEIDELLQSLEPVRERLQEAIQAWDDLGAVAAEAVGVAIDAIASPDAAARLATLLETIASVQGPLQLAAALRREMDERHFAGSAAERWLWAIVERGPLELLVDGSGWQHVQLAARATRRVLDGSAATRLVQQLQQRAATELNLDAVRRAAEPGGLHRWLRARLEAAIGRGLDETGLRDVQQAIGALEQKGLEVYRRLVDAANDAYALSVRAAMSAERTREAVLDLEFDTSTDSGRRALAAAVRGEFGDMLLSPPEGVTVHAGILTNGIERRRSVSVTLPFVSLSSETLTSAVASLAVSREGSAVLLLDARNEVRSRARTSSTLAARAELPIRGVDVHGRTGGITYTFRQFSRDVRTDTLALQLETYARAYFAGSFASDEGFDRARFTAWIDAMERAIDEQASQWDGRRLFGTTVVGLDIRLPPAALVAWTHAPAARNDPAYADLSVALQRAVRTWLFFSFATQIERFVKERSDAFLVFTALPAITHGRERRLHEYELLTRSDRLFWDITDPHLRSAVIRSKTTAGALDARLAHLRLVLEQAGVKTGRRFTLSEVIRNVEERNSLGQRERLDAMLIALRQMISAAAEAARRARAAVDAHREDQALEHLQAFGETLTTTFNQSLGSFFIDEVNFRPFSSLIFLEAARVFDPTLDRQLVAQLSIAALKESATFTEADLLAGKAPAPDQLLIDERLVRTGT